jgi:hypothetical protein
VRADVAHGHPRALRELVDREVGGTLDGVQRCTRSGWPKDLPTVADLPGAIMSRARLALLVCGILLVVSAPTAAAKTDALRMARRARSPRRATSRPA